MKIGCLIYFYGRKFEKLGQCALKSFEKFHPDIELFHVNESNRLDYDAARLMNFYGQGVYKYMLAYEIMIKQKCDKMIILGGDTITCARLDEFIDNNEDDVLVTLSYPFSITYPFSADMKLGGVQTPVISYKKENESFEEYFHFNSDVACFNNADALKETILCSINHGRSHVTLRDLPLAQRDALLNAFDDHSPMTMDYYEDNAGINILSTISHNNQVQADATAWTNLDYNFKIKCVDSPYRESKVVYNIRSKGNIAAGPGEKPWGPFINKWKNENGKLYDAAGKQIKLFHYCDAFGSISNKEYERLMNKYIFEWFNEGTKKFFKEQCDCGDFFDKEFVL